MHEEALERSREQYIQNQRGLRGIFMPLFDEWQLWIIMTATGMSHIGFQRLQVAYIRAISQELASE
jgi:hypothetical protein